MSVLVKGMEMPKCCEDCRLLYDCCSCIVTGYSMAMIGWKMEEKRLPDCPLIELPDHGDLIDRDETAHEMWMKECYECSRVYVNNGCKGCAVTRMINVIACAETAPAVIPAEMSEEEAIKRWKEASKRWDRRTKDDGEACE